MIDREQLIALAEESPLQDPAVKEMLMSWMEETKVTDPEALSIEYVEVAIMHSAMKYRLGFLSTKEVMAELEESGQALYSEKATPRVKTLCDRLSELMRDIEDGTFELVRPRP